jgi:hypothetical protein
MNLTLQPREALPPTSSSCLLAFIGIHLTPLPSISYGLLAPLADPWNPSNPRIFNRLRTLAQKHRGCTLYRYQSPPPPPTDSRHLFRISPLFFSHPKNRRIARPCFPAGWPFALPSHFSGACHDTCRQHASARSARRSIASTVAFCGAPSSPMTRTSATTKRMPGTQNCREELLRRLAGALGRTTMRVERYFEAGEDANAV